MSQESYLTAQQAATRLGVTAATLYAYVSRGLVRSVAVEGQRRRRYSKADVEALVGRKQERKQPERVLRQALHWGHPVIESGLTLIRDNRLFYRGHEVADLLHRPLEAVIDLLWEGIPKPQKLPLDNFSELVNLPMMQRFQRVVADASMLDAAAADLRPDGVRRAGLRLLGLLFSAACGRAVAPAWEEALAACWACGQPRLLRWALVLCADHELNVSAFTARCVASAGANPYAVVGAGLYALSGHRHGGETLRVRAFFDEAERLGCQEAIRTRWQRGESIPGFGHRLYPGGDRRAALLIPELPRPAPLVDALLDCGREMLRDEPNLDFSLVALARTLNLPEEAPMALFALGRTIGWIAHALEQLEDGRLIRPRAQYTGPI